MVTGMQHACELPPEGWHCSREKGHEGPCAAWADTQPFRAAEPVQGHPTPPSMPAAPPVPADLPQEGWDLIEKLLAERRTLHANMSATSSRSSACLNKLRDARALVREYVDACRAVVEHAKGHKGADAVWASDACLLTERANDAYAALERWIDEPA